jgi:uncharacterized membrane protein
MKRPLAGTMIGTNEICANENLDPLVHQVAQLSSAVRRSSARPLLRGDWLGHAVHPLLTDLPIGFWTSAWVLDLIGGKQARPAAQRLVALGLLAVPPTVATGLHDWGDIDDRGQRRVGAVHATTNALATVLYFGSWRARRRGHHARGVAYGMLGATAATFGGYLGGHLVFGTGSDEADTGSDEAGEPAPTVIHAAHPQ